MLFHTNPNVKLVCHKIGVAGICISQGFAKAPKKNDGFVLSNGRKERLAAPLAAGAVRM